MGILFANNVNMQLAADLAADDTSFSVIAGQGSQCPEIATDSTDYMFLKIRNKNGLDEIVKIIEHELNSDTFTIGDSTEVPHTASTDGRAYEETFGGYQTALAITASDKHKITMPVTAATLEDALVVAGSGATTDDFKKLHAITSTHTEINQLHESGVVKADLEKLHDITSSATEINQLHESGVVKADLVALHGATSTPTADTIAKFNSDGIMKGAELNMTDEASAIGTSTSTILDLGTVTAGDRIFMETFADWSNGTPDYAVSSSLMKSSGTATIRFLDSENIVIMDSQSRISSNGNAIAHISTVVQVTGSGSLVMLATMTNHGTRDRNAIYAFFLKKAAAE